VLRTAEYAPFVVFIAAPTIASFTEVVYLPASGYANLQIQFFVLTKVVKCVLRFRLGLEDVRDPSSVFIHW
jgi:hypothetical protein